MAPRKSFPKQFLALTGEQTLFQQTVERLAFDGMQQPLLVCNKDHRFIVKEQLAARKLGVQGLLLELSVATRHPPSALPQ